MSPATCFLCPSSKKTNKTKTKQKDSKISLKIQHRYIKLKGEGYVKKVLLGSKRMQVRLINWLLKQTIKKPNKANITFPIKRITL